jgi:hypothetical protein
VNHQISYLRASGCFPLKAKMLQRKTDHLPSLLPTVSIRGGVPSPPPPIYVFVIWYFVKGREIFVIIFWIGVRFPARVGNFSHRHRVETGSGAHQVSYPMGIGGSFPGCKAAGPEADHSTPSSAEVKEYVELYLHSQYVFMAWCSVKAHGQLYLYL